MTYSPPRKIPRVYVNTSHFDQSIFGTALKTHTRTVAKLTQFKFNEYCERDFKIYIILNLFSQNKEIQVTITYRCLLEYSPQAQSY